MKKRKRKRGRWIVIGLVVVLVAGGVALKVVKGGKKAEVVETVAVKKGTVTDRLTETGTIELVRTVDVKSPISGEIKTLVAEEGDEVHEGQFMAVVEPDPNQTLLLYNKRASVDRARIDLLQKEKELERRRQLSMKNLVSAEELEQMENMVQLARNAHKLSRLELEMLETRSNIVRDSAEGSQELADTRITAPIDGIITRREVEVGEMVVSGISSMMAGTTLFQIGDPSRMIIRSEISEVDVGQIAPDQDVEIVVDAYPDTTYRGRVRRVAPVGRQSQNRGIVVFDTEIEILDREPRLRQGMSCDIDIIFDRRQDVLYLPVEAIFEILDEDVEDIKGKKGVPVTYLKQGDDFVEQAVTIGVESSSRAEILDGLALDDEVASDAEKMREKKEQEKKTEDTGQDDDRS